MFSSLGQHNFSAYTASLFRSHRNFGYLHGSLTPTQKFRITPRVSYTTQKFRISPRVSYTHTEIWDVSPGLLHPYRNSGYLLGSLTPTQKFGISPRVSYTHTEISVSLPGSLTPIQKFGISPRVSYTHTEIRDLSLGLLHPYSRLLTLGD